MDAAGPFVRARRGPDGRAAVGPVTDAQRGQRRLAEQRSALILAAVHIPPSAPSLPFDSKQQRRTTPPPEREEMENVLKKET